MSHLPLAYESLVCTKYRSSHHRCIAIVPTAVSASAFVPFHAPTLEDLWLQLSPIHPPSSQTIVLHDPLVRECAALAVENRHWTSVVYRALHPGQAWRRSEGHYLGLKWDSRTFPKEGRSSRVDSTSDDAFASLPDQQTAAEDHLGSAHSSWYAGYDPPTPSGCTPWTAVAPSSPFYRIAVTKNVLLCFSLCFEKDILDCLGIHTSPRNKHYNQPEECWSTAYSIQHTIR